MSGALARLDPPSLRHQPVHRRDAEIRFINQDALFAGTEVQVF